MTITVVGLGKIGLPLAVQFARKGQKVLGADINPITVELVNHGIEPFPEEENLQVFLSEVVDSGQLSASTSTTECVKISSVVVVVVPLFVNTNAEPDFRAMDMATSEIARGLQPGTLIAYETTLPIGTTRNRFGKMLEDISGLKSGEDFYLAFSPERVFTGRVFSDLRKYPKVVGGINPASTKAAADFYRQVLDFDERPDLSKPNGVWELDSSESAEFVKLAETTYRDVNIGLANQFAKHAETLNINIYDVIESSNSQQYSHIHQPGVAVGGHCIPIYPQFYLWSDPGATIVRSARQVNQDMPQYVAERVLSVMGDISQLRILILGASYRDRVKELAFSGVFPLRDLLQQKGAVCEILDPLFSPTELIENGLVPFTQDYEEIQVVIIQNSSKEFLELFSTTSKFKNVKAIFDGRNLFQGVVPVPGAALYTIGNSERR
jgi:nucleotide sugar dehydrogenase